MNRTRFLASSALLAAAGTTGAVAGVPGGTHFVERKANFDEAGFAKRLGRPADIRQLWEAVPFNPGILDNLKNAINGLQFGFGYAPSRIAMALCGHGPSAAYGYSDYVWKKYRIGEFFKIHGADGTNVATNIYFAARSTHDTDANPDEPSGMYQDTSLAMLQRRGVVVLTCHTAVEEQSRALVKRGFAPAGSSAQHVADDILTHLIPGALVVPSMVAAIAVMQATYRYTYTTIP